MAPLILALALTSSSTVTDILMISATWEARANACRTELDACEATEKVLAHDVPPVVITQPPIETGVDTSTVLLIGGALFLVGLLTGGVVAVATKIAVP